MDESRLAKTSMFFDIIEAPNPVRQGYSITNSVGPDFQNKKFSWARHFQLQVMTHFGPTQMNVLKYTNVLFAVISEKLHQYIFGESDLGKTLQTK